MNTRTAIFSKFRLFEKKYLVSRISCLIFIIACVLYLGQDFSVAATLVTVGAILLFALQFVFQFKWLNWFLGVAILLISLYFLLAVWDEFSEFETVTRAARQLLLVGWGMCFTGIVLSVSMIISCLKNPD